MLTLRSIVVGLLLAVVSSAGIMVCRGVSPLLPPLLAVCAFGALVNPVLSLVGLRRRQWRVGELLSLSGLVAVGCGVSSGLVRPVLSLTSAVQRLEKASVELLAELPERPYLLPPGMRSAARRLMMQRRDAEEIGSRLAELQGLNQRLQQHLAQLFDRYQQQEALTYNCAPEEIAGPRRRRDELRRQLMQLTRHLNELTTDPATATYPSVTEAVAFSRMLNSLYQQQQEYERDIERLTELLGKLQAAPNVDELPKLQAIQLAIQRTQAQSAQLAKQEKALESAYRQKSEQLALAEQALSEEYRAAALTFGAPDAPRPPLSWASVESSFRRVPWERWLGALWLWLLLGVVCCLVAVHVSALLFKVWRTAGTREEGATFPLLQVTAALTGGEEAPSAYRSVWFWLSLLSGACLLWLLPGLAVPWRGLGLALGLGLLLSRRQASSLALGQLWWGASVWLPLLGGVGLWGQVPLGSGLSPVCLTGVGATLMLSVLLVWRARHVLLCLFHPYDVPQTRRVERRGLVRSSVMLWLSLLVLPGILCLGFGVDMALSLLLTALLLLSCALLAYLLACLGLPLGNGVLLPLGQPTAMLAEQWALTGEMPLATSHAMSVRDQLRVAEPSWRTALALALALSVAASGLTALLLCHTPGLGLAHVLPESPSLPWLNAMPSLTWGDGLWLGVGAVVTLALACVRRRWPWCPSPLGLALLAWPSGGRLMLLLLAGWGLGHALRPLRGLRPVHVAGALVLAELLLRLASGG
ncbi:MAG: hypothetical protein ACI4WT_00215 [Oligosphaeraceae bacterium]